MRRYAIEMSVMEWTRVLNNIALVENPSGSTDKLRNLILAVLDSEADPLCELPYNVRQVSDAHA